MNSYIAFLDSHHLENSIFLTAFAKSLAKQGNRKGIIIHGDSEYTERLIQTGMMREDARIRAAKDLNRRLIGLFADHGVPAIGVHGYQKNLIIDEQDSLILDKKQLESFHSTPCLLISNLVNKEGNTVPAELATLARLFSKELDHSEVVLFSKSEQDEILVSPEQNEQHWDDLDEEFLQEILPREFENYQQPALLTTATDFANWPNLSKTTKIT